MSQNKQPVASESPKVDPKVLYHRAMLNVQQELETLKKSSKNPFFKSNYVPLPDMLDVVLPVLNKNGLRLNQKTTIVNHQVKPENVVTSTIIHVETGISEESAIFVPDYGTDMQKLGGAITYARRYTLSALLGLREADDDGNLASGKTTKPPKNTVSKSNSF